MFKQFIGKKVIIRADRAGVFFGELENVQGDEVLLKNCRRLWYWSGAATLSQISLEGVKRPDHSKFSMTVPLLGLRGVIEIIPATQEAIDNIENTWVWKL